METDPKRAATNLYVAAAMAVALSLTSWACCLVGPLLGIGAGLYARQQARWYEALMEPDDFPAQAARVASLAGLTAIVLSTLEIVLLLGLRFVG